MPFLVLFAGTIWLGVEMVDRVAARGGTSGADLPRGSCCLQSALVSPAPIASWGPLGGLLVGTYWLARRPAWRTLVWIAAYGALGMAVMLATWPYLWESPKHFVEVFA